MSLFEFTVTVNNPEAAKAKIESAFVEHGLPVDVAGAFSGQGFAGRYSIVGHDVRVVITDKPIFVFNAVIINKIKGFLDGV